MVGVCFAFMSAHCFNDKYNEEIITKCLMYSLVWFFTLPILLGIYIYYYLFIKRKKIKNE